MEHPAPGGDRLRRRRSAGAARAAVEQSYRCHGAVAAGDGGGGAHGHEYPRALERAQGGFSANREHGAPLVSGQEPDMVNRFVRAYSEAIHVFRTDKAKGSAVYTKRLKQQDVKVIE